MDRVLLMLNLLRKVNLWSKDQTIINGHSLELLQALNGFDLKWLCSLLPKKGKKVKYQKHGSMSKKIIQEKVQSERKW